MRTSLLALSTLCTVLLNTDAQTTAQQPPRVDKYGDPLPSSALARLGTVRWRHGDGAIFVAFLPGGKALLTVGRDETVREWDVATGKELRRFSLADENVRPMPERPRGVYPFGPIFAGIALSADGKMLAVSSPANAVRLFDVAAGKELRRITTSGRSVGVAFSPDGKRLAVQENGGLRLYDTATRAEQLRLLEETERTSYMARGGLAFSPDGKVLASSMLSRGAAGQSPLILWDTATGKELRRITTVTNPRTAEFSPDGKLLAWIFGGTITLADASSGAPIRQLEQKEGPGPFGSFVFAPDSKTLATVDFFATSVVIWEVATGQRKRAFPLAASRSTIGPGSVGRIAFSPDGKLLAVSGIGSAIRVLDVAAGKEIQVEGHQSPVGQLSYARDGKTLLGADVHGAVVAWRVDGGKELRRRIPRERMDGGIALSGDGRHFVSYYPSGKVYLNDAIAGTEVGAVKEVASFFNALAVSPDNRLAAFPVMNDDATLISVYDLVAGKERHRLLPPIADVNQEGFLAVFGGIPARWSFSPDGQILALPFEDNQLVLWNVITGAEICRIQTPRRSGILVFAFSRDSRSLVVDYGGDAPGVWETATGKERRLYGSKSTPASTPAEDERLVRLRVVGGRFRYPGLGRAVALAPDGRLLAHSRPGGAIMLWNVVTGKEVGQLKGHQADVAVLAFGADSQTLASGSSDTTILIWDMRGFAANAKPHAVAVDVSARWDDLLDNDAGRAFEAIWALAAAPEQAVPFLKDHLRPAALDMEKVQQLIADLDDDQFAVRKQASAALEKIGEPAAPSLRKALESGPSPEARRRIEDLLARINSAAPHGEALRSLRAIETLERIGTPAARQVLQTVAQGTPGAALTRAAQAALERMER